MPFLYFQIPACNTCFRFSIGSVVDEGDIESIIQYLPKRKQQMFTAIEQPLSKKEINKSQLALVQLAREMHAKNELNLDDILNADEDDLVE